MYNVTPTTASFISTYAQNTSASTHNFTTTTISPSLVVVSVHSETGGGTNVPAIGVTIGGISATQAVASTSVGASAGVSHTSIWYAVIASSTTAISVNHASSTLRCGIGVYTITDYISSAPTFTGSDTSATFVITRTVNTTSISSGSAIIAAHTSGDRYAHTWSGVTERYDGQIAGGLSGFTGASLDTSSTQSHTIITTTDATPAQGTSLVVAIWK